MLNNLFSSFDVKNFIFFSYILINFYFLLVFSFTFLLNKFFIFYKFLLSFLNNISSMVFLKSVFLLIFFFNFFSLNMYSFSLTSQLSLNFFLIFSLWSPLLFLSLTKINNSFLVHLLPLNTSFFLIPLMVLIELMSFFIRPLTLLLRLSINLIAGHVLVSLISSLILFNSFFFIFLMYIYMLMKFLVMFIQSYIVITLLSLYTEEIYDT